MVNVADPGRLIQQSYYAGMSLDRSEEGQHKAWSPWPWNPIQGGGVGKGGPNGVWAAVRRFEATSEQIVTETIPKLWDMRDENAAAVMQQKIDFERGLPGTVAIRCALLSERDLDDKWGPAIARAQELPACYFTRQFEGTESYLGEGNWRKEQQAPGPPWGKASPPLNAMAAFNADGLGIGVFSPAANERWNFGPHGNGNSSIPTDGPCVHIAPIAKVPLGPHSNFSYRYWLVVGDRPAIALRFDHLLKLYSSEESDVTD